MPVPHRRCQSLRCPHAVRRLLALALLIALAGRGGARAEDPPPRPPSAQSVAQEVVKARSSGASAEVERLARLKAPSAWAVVDALFALGEADAAAVVAEATEDGDRAALQAYVAAERAEPRDDRARAAIEAVNAAFARRDFAAALAAAEGVTGRGLPAVWLHNGRALALRGLKREPESQVAYEAMAAAALRLGWRAGAVGALGRARELADMRRDDEALVRVLGATRDLERERGRTAAAAGATIDLAASVDRRGDPAQGEALLREGIQLAREAGERQFEANGVTNLGLLLVRLRRVEEGEALLREGLALHDTLGNVPNAARARAGLADALRTRGDLPGALELYRAAAQAMQGAGDVLGRGAMLSAVARTQLEQGDEAAAEGTARECLEVVRGTRSAPAQVEAMLLLVRVLQEAEKTLEAEALAQEALDLAQSSGYAAGVQRALTEVARGALMRNELTSAIRHATQALEMAGGAQDDRVTYSSRQTLALALAKSGDTTRALELLQDVHRWLERHGTLHEVARAVANLGFAYTQRGEFGLAIERTLAARDMFARLGDEASVGDALSNLGGLYSNIAEPERAREALREAVQRAEAGRSPDVRAAAWISYGGALAASDAFEEAQEPRGGGGGGRRAANKQILAANPPANLATLAGQRGQHAEALAWLRKAQVRTERLGALSNRSFLHAQAAHLLLDLERPQEAAPEADRALALALECASPDMEGYARVAVMRTAAALGRPQDVLAQLELACDAMDRSTVGLAGVSGESSRGWGAALGLGLAAAHELGDVPAMLSLVERARAVRLREGLGGRAAVRPDDIPAELAQAESNAQAAVITLRARLAAALAAKQTAEARALRKDLDAALEAQREAVERIQSATRLARVAAFPKAVDLAGLRQSLAPDEAYVAYALVEPVALALVVQAAGARVVELGEPRALEEQLAPLVGGQAHAMDDAVLATGRTRLIDPLGLPAGVRRLTISPHGVLCLAPLPALAPGRRVALVPSATALVMLRAGRGAPAADVLALGDPDYGATLASAPPVALRGGKLEPLPGTRAEVKAVGDTVLLGKDATEAGLQRAARARERWRAIHLACHGLVDEQRPLRSSLALAPDASNDGYLSVLEVHRLRLHADLVVLSACDSGRGGLSDSEGVVGFTGAFLLAGADAVLTSLWKVDDDATRALMTRFYELWNPRSKPGDASPKPMPPAEALRLAQAHVRAQPGWEHPRFWAAWQLWGLAD